MLLAILRAQTCTNRASTRWAAKKNTVAALMANITKCNIYLIFTPITKIKNIFFSAKTIHAKKQKSACNNAAIEEHGAQSPVRRVVHPATKDNPMRAKTALCHPKIVYNVLRGF